MATLEVITNTVVGSGGTTSVTFSSIPQTYQHLMFIASAHSQRNASYDGSNTRMNSETSGNNQSQFTLVHSAVDNPTSGTFGATSETNDNRVSYLFDMPASASSSPGPDYFGYSVVYFLNYRWGEYKKVIGRSNAPVDELDAWSYEQTLVTGSWRSTSALTSIRIDPGVTGWAEHSTFTLYGINSA